MKIIIQLSLFFMLVIFYGIAGSWDYEEYQKQNMTQQDLQDLYGVEKRSN